MNIQAFTVEADKGGVGKSASTQLLASALLMDAKNFIAILDADPTQPDVYTAFKRYDKDSGTDPRNCVVHAIDPQNDTPFMTLFSWAYLEGITHIVINLPANSDAAQDVLLIQEATDLSEVPIQWTSLFIATADETSPKCLLNSIKSGYCSIASRRLVIKTGAANAGREADIDKNIDIAAELVSGMDVTFVSEKLPRLDSFMLDDFRSGENHYPIFHFATRQVSSHPDVTAQMQLKAKLKKINKLIGG